MPTKKNDLLSSWKEIASYLDCDVRTAHRWEKEYGLPVHRLGQGSRARVFAYEHELEAWLRRKSDGENEDDSLNFWTKALAILAGLIILGGISYFVYTYITFDREPFDFDINRSELIILNQDGQELWRYDFPIDYNLNEQLYLNRFQNKIFSRSRSELPVIQIKDINRDSHREVLFAVTEVVDGRLFCFSYRGKILWEIQTGRELTFGSKIYSNEYRLSKFLSADIDGDGYHEIALTSNHTPEFPTQMMLINYKGEKLGGYWHSGRIVDIVFDDINGDGIKDIITGGVNNQFDSPFIAVFDSTNISGCSPNSGEYACSALEPGSEKYYIRLPFTDAARAVGPNETIGKIRPKDNGIWSFSTWPVDLQYRFDEDFRILEVRDSHNFERQYREARQNGYISGELNQAYLDSLKDQVRWHNGEKWVAEPAMRNEW
jgi:hypothetical protein